MLITRVTFGPGKPNGIALARMVRVKRPGTKVLFIAREEYAASATRPISFGAHHPHLGVQCVDAGRGDVPLSRLQFR